MVGPLETYFDGMFADADGKHTAHYAANKPPPRSAATTMTAMRPST